MTAIPSVISPVQLRAEDRPEQPPVTLELVELYEGFEKALLVPLWTEIGDLMPLSPKTKAQPHRWEWKTLLETGRPLRRAGADRPWRRTSCDRAGQPQPEWQALRQPDAVGGDPVPDAGRGRPGAPAHAERLPLRRRGRGRMDSRGAATRSRCVAATSCRRPAGTGTPTTTPPASRWPGSTASTSRSSTRWRRQFFEPSAGTSSPRRSTTHRSDPAPNGCGVIPACARYPSGTTDGLTAARPIAGRTPTPHSPTSWRWRRAVDGTVGPGHAAGPVHQPDQRQGRPADDPRARSTASRRGTRDRSAREIGSSVYQVFDGTGRSPSANTSWTVTRGDLFVVPSWVSFSAKSEASASDSDSGALDLFRFSDAPIFEALHAHRVQVEGQHR